MSFAYLHIPCSPLTIPNAWDAGSAAVLQEAGAAAVATTSGGVAWSLGYPDGNALPVEELVAAVARIARVLHIPLSVDIESGFHLAPGPVADVAAQVHSAGAVGINIEDSWNGALLRPEVQAERIRAIHERVPSLFINARVDAFLLNVEDPMGELDARLPLLSAAGASGVFVPGLTDLDALSRITASSPLPVSVLATPTGPTVSEFATAGVARISTGTDLADAAYGRLREHADAIINDGRFDVTDEGFGYAAMNALLAR